MAKGKNIISMENGKHIKQYDSNFEKIPHKKNLEHY